MDWVIWTGGQKRLNVDDLIGCEEFPAHDDSLFFSDHTILQVNPWAIWTYLDFRNRLAVSPILYGCLTPLSYGPEIPILREGNPSNLAKFQVSEGTLDRKIWKLDGPLDTVGVPPFPINPCRDKIGFLFPG